LTLSRTLKAIALGGLLGQSGVGAYVGTLLHLHAMSIGQSNVVTALLVHLCQQGFFTEGEVEDQTGLGLLVPPRRTGAWDGLQACIYTGPRQAECSLLSRCCS
jgi:hypothetical protein